MSWSAAALQDKSILTGEIGGPKGAYQGAEPTRFGTCPVHGLVIKSVHGGVSCGKMLSAGEPHTFSFLSFPGDWERGGRCTDF